jgi:hypothetical protein
MLDDVRNAVLARVQFLGAEAHYLTVSKRGPNVSLGPKGRSARAAAYR